ncbi:Fe3+-citrate ABC transporter substrate-binding protein [Vibrio sp. Makdt]|uniref:Fe3+-citrate ABC transporter substrate-binding protein n=1 Tax=Vibrio sp. Makdt TaxID=2998828 RepID=UPI0022CD630E|nr:Fe3+-citrate ABC transporter substrate-binding protein [Vibrio sp. Makdt]MDA0152172.1 Fe3+-citrate ABC transporter substrate-binding protein [Vibrio sp. Makdt]
MKFISKSKTAFKISIMSPSGEMIYRTIGFIRIGEEQAQREAIKTRNELGSEAWGEFWPQILNDPKILIRLPSTTEPTLREEHDRYGNKTLLYRAMWSEWDEEGNRKRKCLKRSVNAHGYDGAYEICRSALMKAYQVYIPLIEFMKSNGSERFINFET